MEYSVSDLDRKFTNSIIKGKISRPNSSTSSEGFFHIDAVESHENGYACMYVRKIPFLEGECFRYPVSTFRATIPTDKPYFTPYYWYPESGIYHGYQGRVYLVVRRAKRSYSVGLHHNSYDIRRIYPDGTLGERDSSSAVDVVQPRVFNQENILTEKIYKGTSTLFFLTQAIGVSSQEHLMLSSPDYIPFLPPTALEKWKLSH